MAFSNPTAINVTVAQLSDWTSTPAIDTLKVANDGTQISGFTSFTVTPPPNAAPPARGYTDDVRKTRTASRSSSTTSAATSSCSTAARPVDAALQSPHRRLDGTNTTDLLMRDATTSVTSQRQQRRRHRRRCRRQRPRWTVSGFRSCSTRATRPTSSAAIAISRSSTSPTTPSRLQGLMGKIVWNRRIAGFRSSSRQ